MAISLIILLSLIPFASGGFNVDLPEQIEIVWTYADGIIHFSAPVGIVNGGVFDISEVTINCTIQNSTGFNIVQKDLLWGNISAQSEVRKFFSFDIDLNSLMRNGSDWMLYHSDVFGMDLKIDAKYALGLVGFSANYHTSIQWRGLFNNVEVHAANLISDIVDDSTNCRTENDSYEIKIPLDFNACPYVKDIDFDLTVNFTNRYIVDPIEIRQQIMLRDQHFVNISFSIDQESLRSLVLDDGRVNAEFTIRLTDDIILHFEKQVDFEQIMEMIR